MHDDDQGWGQIRPKRSPGCVARRSRARRCWDRSFGTRTRRLESNAVDPKVLALRLAVDAPFVQAWALVELTPIAAPPRWPPPSSAAVHPYRVVSPGRLLLGGAPGGSAACPSAACPGVYSTALPRHLCQSCASRLTPRSRPMTPMSQEGVTVAGRSRPDDPQPARSSRCDGCSGREPLLTWGRDPRSGTARDAREPGAGGAASRACVESSGCSTKSSGRLAESATTSRSSAPRSSPKVRCPGSVTSGRPRWRTSCGGSDRSSLRRPVRRGRRCRPCPGVLDRGRAGRS